MLAWQLPTEQFSVKKLPGLSWKTTCNLCSNLDETRICIRFRRLDLRNSIPNTASSHLRNSGLDRFFFSEHCASYGSKNTIWLHLRGKGIYMSFSRTEPNFHHREPRQDNFHHIHPCLFSPRQSQPMAIPIRDYSHLDIIFSHPSSIISIEKTPLISFPGGRLENKSSFQEKHSFYIWLYTFTISNHKFSCV